MRSILQAEVQERGLAPHFRFLGTVPNDETPQLIAACDFAVYPSFAEATSVSALEVMAMARPVVASDVGGLPEIVFPEETGLLVPFHVRESTYGDLGLLPDSEEGLIAAVLRMVHDDDARRRMGEGARRFVVENASWPAYVARIEKIYHAANRCPVSQ